MLISYLALINPAHLTLVAVLLVVCLLWCLYMMTMAMMKNPMLATNISNTGAINDQIKEFSGFK
jgi:asparagine N-glycosylation enzyme membrane subunit Stt3